jgi:hypothetical protein
MIRIRICTVGRQSDYGGGGTVRWHQTGSGGADHLEQKESCNNHLMKERNRSSAVELHQNLMRFRRKTGTNPNAALIWLSCLAGAIGE